MNSIKKIIFIAVRAGVALGMVAVVGCSADMGDSAEKGGEESVSATAEGVSPSTCNASDAFDQWIYWNWDYQAVLSDQVDEFSNGYLYNSYLYDQSQMCPDSFVTDVTARPNGDPVMSYRFTLQLLDTPGMDATRCSHLHLDWAMYLENFARDGVWHYFASGFDTANWNASTGRCTLPARVSYNFDWKAGVSGFGKVGGVRWAIAGYEGDRLIKTCLALDTDNGGAHLNSLCPIYRY